MDYGPSHAQGQDYQQRTNGTGGDMPTGYRPCPFCHSVIPWESERCPSCGRVLIERVGPGSSQRPPSVSRSAGRTSWWSGRRTSGAGTPPKRRAACRAAFLDESALDLAGVVVDDQPWHLMVCVPAGTVPRAPTMAGFDPHTYGAGASDPVHRLRPDGRAVRRRAPHQVSGGLLDPFRDVT